MKNGMQYILGSVMALMFFQGCSEDTGNYDYSEIPDIGIGGLQAVYDRQRLDSLNIPVTVSTDYDASDLKYTWFIYDPKTDFMSDAEVDTIGREKDLAYLVTQNTGTYRLVVKVENTANGYAVYASANVNVESEFSRGFYVLKETADGNTDLDFCSDSLEMGRDIFQRMKGGALRGRPLFLAQMMDHPYIDPAHNKRAKDHAVGITTDEEVCVLRTTDLATVHDSKSLFYAGKSDGNPRRLARGYKCAVYFSGNAIYTVGVGSEASGILGVPQATGTDVRWVAYDKQSQMTSGFLGYDEKQGRFLFVSTVTSSGSVTFFQGDSGENQPNRITDSCLFMGMSYHAAKKNTAYAVFESAGGGRKLYELQYGMASSNPIKSVKKIDDGMKFSRATAFAMCAFDAPIMYFLADGKLYYYSLQDGSEREIRIPGLAAGETINYFSNKYWSSMDSYYSKDYLVIGTTTGNNDYTLRMFGMNGGMPSGDPVFQFSGTGKVADLQYMTSLWYGNEEFKYQTYTRYPKMGLCY